MLGRKVVKGEKLPRKNLNLSPEKIRKMIADQAYANYCNRAPHEGNAESDWLKAEKQVKQELGLR